MSKKYIDYFFDSRKPLADVRAKAVEEDWELLMNVFPEPGFRTYFVGFIISKLAKELRNHGIKSATDRDNFVEFSSLTRLLSNISVTREEAESVLRRGTGSAHHRGEGGEGVAADSAKSVSGGSGQKEEGRGEET